MEQKRYKIKITGNIKKDSHTEYTLTIEIDNLTFSISQRYSILKKLADTMKIEANNNNSFPKFPPKKFFGTEDAKFINKRQNDLKIFFDSISNSPIFSKLPSFIKFIEENKKKHEATLSDSKPQIKVEQNKQKNVTQNFGEKKTKLLSQKEIKKTEEELSKIVNESSKQFYDVNNYYDKDMTSDNDCYIKFFNNNKIENNSNENLTSKDDINFELIGKKDDNLDSIEVMNKNKLEEMENIWKSLDEAFNVNGIIVPI